MVTKFHEGIQNFQGCVGLYRRNELYLFEATPNSNLNSSLSLSKTDADFVIMKIITNIDLKLVDSTKRGWFQVRVQFCYKQGHCWLLIAAFPAQVRSQQSVCLPLFQRIFDQKLYPKRHLFDNQLKGSVICYFFTFLRTKQTCSNG